MRCLPLLLCVLLLTVIPLPSEPAAATSDYTTREIDSFETTVNETSIYGNWTSSANALGSGASSYVLRSSLYQTHGFYSARLNVSGDTPVTWAEAVHTFNSSEEVGLFLFDKVTFDFRLSRSDWIGYWMLRQYNGTVEVDRLSNHLTGTMWQTLILMPTWVHNATWFRLDVYLSHVFEYSEVPTWCDLYLDNFRVCSSEVDVRIRYWNLYTGLGYYTEKLLARYYTFESGWVDIWEGEFQAYKGDEVLVSVTDVFQRNVWTGIVVVDSSPVYVDIMVPIVTVHIGKPNWYNDSVPMEWRVTCLPWGPDGPGGMTLPAIGFEFEVLAGWYNLAWLDNGVVSAGNQSFLIEGNATDFRGTMVLSDLSIPMDPDYEVVVEGDDGRIFDIKDFDDLIALCAALYEDDRVKAALLISGLTGLLLALYRFNRAATKKAQGLKGGN